ncbi:MAG: SDR family oxidoreductase [Hoeflea sp.]|uniref:D-erythronate dehydrogenase n=1 Tax=Hoeflea sp. TaxID=1940281 RepID=UPI001D4039FD|nr:D-erythronate dehydrogenase [Hoeflea sp.]MBU4531289.1 SDR family oxidoreductase [Alphaproteobacteria bacterium]MBU4544146.1 SDR family oxidoreductase [Alphaproteobacteria bacterium]MBU4550617.1 SDR family oxidoreductase [Alphaproteobacteria bacterium]MBV1724566.1 SDR family oxidoreductase [Hoeflea sp.]MBV1760586.1 SDR family oxidoreductase [Hoeflea sp.]
MHVLIIGAAGMIGRKLAGAISRSGKLGTRPVDKLSLIDAVTPEKPAGFSGAVTSLALDISDPHAAPQMLAHRPDVIVHLAAIVSGEAEQDFDKGYRINLDGTRHLFDAVRQLSLTNGYCPRLVFASSIAVFGAPMPDAIDDVFLTAPMTSYGTQKAIGELLLQDYSRRGFFDGLAIRLPTICIRPGLPNKAASGFFSGILREPLAGKPAVLPVPDTVRHWHASPRAAVDFLTRAATMDLGPVGHRRVLNMPGLSATVAEQIEALRRIAGDSAVALIRHEPDPDIMRIVSTWPRGFAAERATALGFRAESSFDEIIRIHIEDEMGGAL